MLSDQGRLTQGAAGAQLANQDGCCCAEPHRCDGPTICLGEEGLRRSQICASWAWDCAELLGSSFAFTQLKVRLSMTSFNISPKTWKLLVSLHWGCFWRRPALLLDSRDWSSISIRLRTQEFLTVAAVGSKLSYALTSFGFKPSLVGILAAGNDRGKRAK